MEQTKIKPIPKEKGCRIIIKKRKDGAIVKEISGDCTSEQLKALEKQKDFEE